MFGSPAIERITMTALLELAPRDAGEATREVDVEFPEGVSLIENVACFFTCTPVCGTSDCGPFQADDEV
jgi:hypothetical protein